MTNNDKRWKWPTGAGTYAYKIDQSVTSHNQSGGITAHTVNMEPQERTLTNELRVQLLQRVPRERTVQVLSPMGDGEAIRLANEILNFLSRQGFKMDEGGLAQCVWSKPPQGQTIDTDSNPDVVQIIIGHR